MSEFKLTTVEEFEEATARLLETGAKVGADAWQFRVKNQTPHCKFGEQGVCCRICAMGPCRITPKAPRGICGCDVHGIVGRNLSLIHISEPTRRVVISYAVFCLKKIFFNDTATTEIYTRLFVGSVRCV